MDETASGPEPNDPGTNGPEIGGAPAEGPGQFNAAAEGQGQSSTAAEGPGQFNAEAGRLLVATPVLGDPNFRRTVVLVVEHEEEQGTLGVVLNRPTEVPVGQVLEPWTDLATDPSVVFSGGPVAPNSALALALVPGTDEPIGWHPLDGGPPTMARLGLVDLDAPPGLLAPAITRLRVYAGYAGWGAGQLQGEIDEGAWYVLPGEPADAFSAEPARLWSAVLRRQGGELAYVATFPDDPTLN